MQELEETGYWLELIGEVGILPEQRLKPLRDETEELIAIFVAIVRNIKKKK